MGLCLPETAEQGLGDLVESVQPFSGQNKNPLFRTFFFDGSISYELFNNSYG